MDKFFKIRENGSTVPREVVAGLTTFFAMSYIIFVNPAILSQTGMPSGAIFLATIFSAIAGTLVMGLFANVPYAQAPGMGLNAFFTYTVCFGLGFKWQEALAMVFICGLINVLITVTRVRKMIIHAIPESLQHAIGGGIGIFVAYIGIKNAGLLTFLGDPGHYIFNNPADAQSGIVVDSGIVPTLAKLSTSPVLLALIGLLILVVLLIKKVPGAVLISIIATTLIGIPMGVTDLSHFGANAGISKAFSELGTTFGAAFGDPGMVSLFSDLHKLPLVLMTIFAFSLSDTFDTIGTFIGTGRRSGIFKIDDEEKMAQSSGFKTKMDKALFADATATSIGAIFGTSNTTTYVESSAGIEAGGRTGLVSVVVSALFALCILIAPVVGIVPGVATAPVLILVGIMMMAALRDIVWTDLEEAIPAFFASVFMAFSYSISNGIAFGFVTYILVKVFAGKVRTVHPIIWVSTALFIANFVIMALI